MSASFRKRSPSSAASLVRHVASALDSEGLDANHLPSYDFLYRTTLHKTNIPPWEKENHLQTYLGWGYVMLVPRRIDICSLSEFLLFPMVPYFRVNNSWFRSPARGSSNSSPSQRENSSGMSPGFGDDRYDSMMDDWNMQSLNQHETKPK